MSKMPRKRRKKKQRSSIRIGVLTDPRRADDVAAGLAGPHGEFAQEAFDRDFGDYLDDLSNENDQDRFQE